MIHQKLARFFSSDIGIDLGTANCLVYVKDKGIVLDEPSVVAIDTMTEKVIAVGEEAKRMLGRNPVNINVIRPMKAGVIADFEITEEMLRYFISKAKMFIMPRRRLVKPRVLIAVPSGITEVEKRAVQDSAVHAGARDVILLEEPMASAIGVGLPVAEPGGNMIVDIGGGTTEVAIITISGPSEQKSVDVGGDEMDEAIINHMKREYNLAIGPRMAEDIKIGIGSAYPLDEEKTMEVKGRDLVSGLPKAIRVSSKEIRKCLREPLTSIVEAVRNTLERCKPDMAGDLINRGIMLAGGGALLPGLDKLISEEMNLPVFVAEDALQAVAKGTGIVLQEMGDMNRSYSSLN